VLLKSDSDVEETFVRSEASKSSFNEGKSAASFCNQATAWFPDMFCNLNLAKNQNIAKNSTTT
jgi:hypothetical protein